MAPGLSRAVTGAAALAVAGAAVSAGLYGGWDELGPVLACAPAVVVAWLVVRREPSSSVGPALAWSTAAVAVVTAHNSGPLQVLPWSSGIWPLNLSGLLALLLVFPSGLLPGALWRSVPVLFGLATAGMVAVQWGAVQEGGRVVGGPGGAWVEPVGVASLAAVGASLLAAACSVAVRHRRGDHRTRQQVRWLLVAGLVVLVLLVAGWAAEALGASLDAAYSPFLTAIVTAVPAAVGIAVVRHDLFDVDRLLSATTAWIVTVVLAAGVFGAVVYALGSAVSVSTGVRSSVAAFVTALVLLPLQHGLAVAVGRVVDRDRHVAIAAAERFAADVRAGRRQPEEVEAVLREVQDDPDLVVALARSRGGWVRVDGSPAPSDGGVPVEAGGDVIARVHLGWDSARARRRLADVARVLWVPVEVSRLRLVLREAAAEAEAARGRLAEAAAQERRRLERDLHDGAQQRIIATGMRLRMLQERLPDDDAAEVDSAVRELRETVDELRRIAQGVRPSRLDDGLAAALAAVRRTAPLPVDLEVDELPELSEHRALTAYLVVSEAVTNVLKHARATRIGVRVSAAGDRLGVEVRDDGVGGVEGDLPLTALRDRVLSAGGSVDVESEPGRGTTVRAVL